PRHSTPLALHAFPTRRSSDLSQGDLVELAAGGAALVPYDRALRRSHSDRVHANPQVRGPVDHSERRRALVVLAVGQEHDARGREDRKSTRLNSSHQIISYAVF